MKESIGSTWVLQLVIAFILLFVGFLTLSLGYSKSYKVKNETLSIIEKYEGLNSQSIEIINNYLVYNNYDSMGKCEDSTWYGVKDISVTTLETVNPDEKYYYCVKKKIAKNEMSYYELNTFFKFHLPIVGDFTSFTIEGSTADIYSMDNYTAYN